MHILWTYLRPHGRLAALALLLAAASQVLALFDPIIFEQVGPLGDQADLAARQVEIKRPQRSIGTLRENIRFVKPDATDAEIVAAMEPASCAYLLDKSGDGLDTLIGEMGMKLSGGERQRLSIARALIRQPPLLIFDEATSALDSLTEEQITNTVRALSAQGERITILIAHRLSTVMHADTIFVLEKGRIVESGRHAALLEQKGLYYAMWRQQIGERPAALASAFA